VALFCFGCFLLFYRRMLKKFSALIFFVLFSVCSLVLLACSDDDSSIEYLFDREVSDLSVVRQCASRADSASHCYQIRFRYPYATENLSKMYLWVDSLVVGDTAKAVDGDKLAKADTVIEFKQTTELYDTIDLTHFIKKYVDEERNVIDRDSLMIAIYCEYSSGDPGSVQRVMLHFVDDIKPLFKVIGAADSQWTTGAMFKWTRPTDQTDFYAVNDLSGVIYGYNITIYAENADEDLSGLKVTVISPEGTDSTGEKVYQRNASIHKSNDSIWVKTVEVRDNNRHYLYIAVLDGLGYNVDDPDSNVFHLVIEGLKPESYYRIASSAYDEVGNFSGNEKSSLTVWQEFNTTDSIAPLISTKIYTIEDSLYPGMARLDSNNQLRIFWGRSVDPRKAEHNIKVDTVLYIPGDCVEGICFDSVATYEIRYYDKLKKEWVKFDRQALSDSTYENTYKLDADTMKPLIDVAGANGLSSFVSNGIRWVAPGDTLILQIRSVDKSGYHSLALIDTIAVSPGSLAKQVECPEGFVAVKASDSAGVFCMERYEHRNDSGKFVFDVLHSEAVAACAGISASGFTVSLCKERDWELVCLSGGTLSYGVIEDGSSEASEYLFSSCNVATNDSASAASIATRSSRCMNPMGVHDMPGQYQEWVLGRSEDTVAVVKGGSYKLFGGLDRESQALCTNRSFPYYTRQAYTTDTVYLYREGTKVDTVYEADTSRTLYKMLTSADFKDTLQFFDVQDSSGNSIGTDYAPYAEYKKGGDEWLETLGKGLKYVPTETKVVFLTGERVAYRQAGAFYKSPAIGFRCCAYPQDAE